MLIQAPLYRRLQILKTKRAAMKRRRRLKIPHRTIPPTMNRLLLAKPLKVLHRMLLNPVLPDRL
jgi:hypothetical protein